MATGEGEFEVKVEVVVEAYGHPLRDIPKIERTVARALRSQFGDHVKVLGQEGQVVEPWPTT